MSASETDRLRAELTAIGMRIVERRLAVGPGGNISVRYDHGMLISPSGFALDEVTPNDWVFVDIEQPIDLEQEPRPSSEAAMHASIYRFRSDVTAIVHSHPPVTIAVISSGHHRVPLLFPDQVALVGDLPHIPYVRPCSQELADAVVKAMGQANGLLLQNHGLITVGSNIKQAFYRTEIVEDAARVFWMAKSIGTPRTLTDTEAAAVLELDAEKYRQRLLGAGSEQ